LNILSIDPYGLSLHWCLDCLAAGHTVKLITVGPKAKPIGEGLVDKFDNWQQAKSYAKFADLIFVADNVDFMDEVMELRKQGLPVFGPDKRSARLEVDRMYGQNAIKGCGNAVIPSTEFSNYDQAIAFVKANPNRYCCKPCGEVEDKSLTYLAKDPADMIGFLTRMKKVGKKAGITKFILQEFKKGTELAVMGMFGPHGFNSVFCENFEHKKLMNGDLGVSTGEMGTAIRYTKDSKLADIMLRPLEKLLHELKYVGFVDISVIVDENDGTPWPMEFTQRPGYPIHNIQQPLIVGDPAQWMVDLINGKDTFEIIGGETCVGVVMACGDFPFATKEIEAYLDFPVITDDVKDISMVSPCEIKLSSTIKMVDDEVVENYPEWGTAGTYIAVCMGLGDTITQAKDAAYTVVKQVKLGNDPAYRTDIGDSCEDRLKQLHKFDYCNDWKFK